MGQGASASCCSGWAYDPVIVATDLKIPLAGSGPTPGGVLFRYTESDQPDLADILPAAAGQAPTGPVKTIGVRKTIDLASVPHRAENYGIYYDAYLDVPDDAGYTFTLLGNDTGLLKIDGEVVASTPAIFPQVCGSAGNAVRTSFGSRALAKGKHRIQVAETHTKGVDGFKVYWQRAGKPLEPIPMEVLSHERDMQ
jgi:hypothetical protein